MLKLITFTIFVIYTVNFCDGAPRIPSSSHTNSIAYSLPKNESNPDESKARAEELYDLFKNQYELIVEKLPMVFVVLFNEKAKEDGISLDEFLTIMRIGIQLETNKRNNQLTGREKEDIKGMCPAILLDFKAKPESDQIDLERGMKLAELGSKLGAAKTLSEHIAAMTQMCEFWKAP